MAPFRVGVCFEENQVSDIVGVDILGSCSKQYVTEAADFGTGPLIEHAQEMEILYISSTLEPARTTPSIYIVPTHTYDNAPRDLDILLIGGPLLSHRPPTSIKFFQEAAQQTKVIMTVCVGSLWLADSGVLQGRKATTNRGALGVGKKLHPEIEWLDQRWVIDKEPTKEAKCTFWTAGGAGAGIDMVATYIREHFNPQVAQVICDGLDFDPTIRGQFYQAGSHSSLAAPASDS